MTRKAKTFTVFIEGDYQALAVIPATKVAVKAWVRERVTSTHMGELRKLPRCGYEYATTIGRYYQFVPSLN